ncbi:MAG: HAMP domain-containing protein [Anaerolineales bacterium]|uniref:sensor histidine kinase n=1 Tax=Candidatus Villigracilis vicinus TaxID=3140679 RepID=UPI00313599B7|nr:HAMP domain-containing protein [Anaerolineales bacterium]MBK9779566.1 HAMP domain-containing protein [Anaerolineales bacterium]
MSIRLKVALPFLLLTVVVSVIGVYVVTRLVTGTLTERLTNQLLESGRVVSDSFIRQEGQHVKEAIRIIYTAGLADAVDNDDRETVLKIVEPAFGSGTIENLIIVSPQGKEILHLLRDTTGEIIVVEQDTGAPQSPIVIPFLEERNPDDPPRRALGGNQVDDEVYYYTAMPISVDGRFGGVIILGTSIKTLLPAFKQVALADIVLYGNTGQAISTTIGAADEEMLSLLNIPEDQYLEIINTKENLVTGVNIEVSGRQFTIGRAPIQIGNDRIGVFAVALPTDFVVQFGASNRTVYVLVFTALMLAVVVIGYFVSRMIIVPLYSLVNTSQAIAGGDLNRRTGIRTGDEIGALANTFDEMTSRLQDRTIELEEKNETLRKMDKTKTNFIQISAHELRTPLTLIMGYSQMLEQDLKNNPELQNLAQGILEGAERMTDVVDSMLDVSRIDSNSLVLRKIDTHVNLIIRKVYKEFGSAFEERSIRFDTENLEKLPSVCADPEMLQKVFYHLVMNAIKYTPDGGQVKVSGRYVNGVVPPQLEITVCDTGIGVDPGMHEMIFQKFNQTGEVLLHSSGKTKFKGGGPGLGLAIARGIVHAHGGRIWVESSGHDEEKFPGSKFIVSLPAQKKES